MLQILFHDHFVWVFSSDFGYQSILPHNPLDFLVIHLRQSHFDASPTIFALTLVKNLFDFEIIRVVFAWLICLTQPSVVSASRDPRQFAKDIYIIL